MRGFKGFTLVELLVVIVVMAILAAIGISVFSGVQKNARDTKKKGDVEAIAKVLESKYRPQAGQYVASYSAEDFTSKVKPEQSAGVDYEVTFSPSETSPEGFQVCATLETSSEKYCRDSSQGKFIAVATPIPTSTSSPTLSIPTATLTPTPTPQTFRYIFVTSQTYTGNSLGGLSGADAKCLSLAKAAGLGDWYKAWLSDSTTNAKDRIFQSYLPYKDTKGNVVANDFDDLISGNLRKPIIYTEAGIRMTLFQYAWTNTDQFGVRKNSTSNKVCNDWQSQSGVVFSTGSRGDTAYTSSRWTDYSSVSCVYSLHLYCLQDY